MVYVPRIQPYAFNTGASARMCVWVCVCVCICSYVYEWICVYRTYYEFGIIKDFTMCFNWSKLQTQTKIFKCIVINVINSTHSFATRYAKLRVTVRRRYNVSSFYFIFNLVLLGVYSLSESSILFLERTKIYLGYFSASMYIYPGY